MTFLFKFFLTLLKPFLMSLLSTLLKIENLSVHILNSKLFATEQRSEKTQKYVTA